MIKLIVSDMDGTFLNPKGVYDKERFQKLLDKMTEKGISFVVASGNRMDRLNAIFQEFLVTLILLLKMERLLLIMVKWLRVSLCQKNR